MTFFYNLNKTLDAIREKPEVTHGQLNERDMGKHNNATTGFKALAKKAGGGEKGERIAGAQFQKMKKAGQLEETGMDESAFQAAIGKKKYGDEGMKALQKAGREHASDKTMSNIRNKFDKYDEGAYQAGPDKSQIPAVNRPGNKMTLQDLEKERNQSPTTPDGMRALQNKLKNIHPMDAQEGVDKAAFAALAPPKDKITFADKIAGAKKEVDEMLGDVAAEAIKGALSGKQKKLDKNNNGKLDAQDFAMLRKGGKKMADESKDDDEDDVYSYQDPSKKKTHKTASGGTVTRHGGVTRHQAAPGHYGGYDPETDPDKDDDKPGTPAGEKRGRGRPKGPAKGPERVTANATKHKGGRKVKEGDFGPMEEGADYGQAQQIYNDLADLRAIAKQAQGAGGGKFPQGFASRLESTLWAVMTLLKNQQSGGAQVREQESTPKKDNHAEKAGKRVTKDIEYDEKKKDGIHGKKRGAEDDKAEKAGKKVAKDIEYDEKKKDKKEDKPKKVKEAGGTDTPTASSGFSYGKGIYDSINHEIEKMIAESMNISMNSSTEGDKSLTITATEEDAVKLSMLLNTAGLGGDSEGYGGGGYQSSCGCGTPDCSCGDQEMEMDEAAPTVSDNEPDYPTNTETNDDALQYSGGLNKPKTDVAGDGQTTIPNTAVHTQDEDALRRLREMAGIKEAAKPDFLDMDKDGDKKEPMKKAVDDKEKKVEESILSLTNLWKTYKG